MTHLVISKVKLLFNDNRSKKVLKNIINSFIIKIFSTIVSLSLIPISIKYVEKESYGVWLTISSVITWVSIFDFGLANGLTNKLSEAFAKKNKDLARIYLSTTYAILFLIVTLLSIIFFSVENFINWNNVFSTSINKENLSFVIKITFASFLLLFLFKPISSLLMAEQKHFLNTAILLLGNLAALIIIYFYGGRSNNPFVFLSVVLGFSYPIALFISTIYLYLTKYRSLLPSFAKINFQYRKELFGLSIKFFVIQVSVLAIFTSNNFIISYFIDNKNVTYYNIAYRYFSIITIFQSMIMTPLWPAFTEAYTLSDFTWIKKIVSKVNRLNILLCIVLVFMFLICDKIYDLWIGNLVTIPFELNILLPIYVGIGIFKETYNSFINGVGRLNLQVAYSVLTIILQIPLAYLFIVIFKLEISGLLLLNIIWVLLALILYKTQYGRVILKTNSLKRIWN